MRTLFALLALYSIAAADELVIPLKVASGHIGPHGDNRIFAVPVRCGGVEADWVWGCGGYTTVSQAFANRCALTILPESDLEDVRDADGQPMFVGEARTTLWFGGRTHKSTVKVMRDSIYNRGMTGVIGYDVAIAFQWEINPDPLKPTLTLRPPGSQTPRKPILTLPLKDDRDNLWINVKIRNVPVDVLLMPQSSDIQIAPDLQRKWDIESGLQHDVVGYLGPERTRKLTGGKDCVELSPELREHNLVVILVGDKNRPELTPAARSGIGQSLLNRFHYAVDARLGKFMIYQRCSATTRPATPDTRLP